MKVEITKDTKCVNEIVQIHMATFQGFFLTFLGKGFLKQLYKGFIQHPYSGIIVASNNEKILGFCAFSENLSDFYKYLVKKKLFILALYAFGAFLRNPKVLIRLLRAFTYSEKAKKNKPYVELSSIGVLPGEKNKGIATRMIKFLKEYFRGMGFEYIKLETDKENNEVANMFYQKNEFILKRIYETPEGRAMNEYRFYFGEQK